MNPTIVVIGHNRPAALQRLLTSLQQAAYPPNVRLHISLDSGGDQQHEVYDVAQQAAWPFGEKVLVAHAQPLGLVRHVLGCGDLTEKYGRIILLEDDLFVSPMFYQFAVQALDAYADDLAIAGVSLNNLWFNGLTHTPFVPYLDAADVFFMQIPWYQGQAFTVQMWRRFREWEGDRNLTQRRKGAEGKEDGGRLLHELFDEFAADEWFPLMSRYVVENGRFYVFPRQSLTTNFGDIGTHFSQPTPWFQTPLQTQTSSYHFQTLAQSLAVYDAFHEMLPDCLNRLTKQFHQYDYAVDLNGTKSRQILTEPFVLTTRRSKRPLLSFGRQMWPQIANVVHHVPGDEIVFSYADDLVWGRRADWQIEWRRERYFRRNRLPTGRQRLRWWLARRLG